MTVLSVLSWNIEGRLSPIVTTGRGNPAHIEKAIIDQRADIVVLPEALGWGRLARSTVNHFDEAGYQWVETKYKDVNRIEPNRWNDPSIMILSKLPIISSTIIRPGDLRSLLSVDIDCHGKIIRFIAVHLEERSEQRRLAMVRSLVLLINDSPYPLCMAGDFNAMISSDIRAQFMRLLPLKARDTQTFHALRQLRELTEMADGRTMTYLLETSIVPADSSKKATITPKSRTAPWLPSIPLFKIDHILTSRSVQCTPITVLSDHGSDHRGITTQLSFER